MAPNQLVSHKRLHWWFVDLCDFQKANSEQLAADELFGGQSDPQTEGTTVNDTISKTIICQCVTYNE